MTHQVGIENSGAFYTFYFREGAIFCNKMYIYFLLQISGGVLQ